MEFNNVCSGYKLKLNIYQWCFLYDCTLVPYASAYANFLLTHHGHILEVHQSYFELNANCVL